MVLVAGHAPFTWGANASKAVYHSVILEELARMAQLTESLNPRARDLESHVLDKHYQRKHGPKAVYGQEERA